MFYLFLLLVAAISIGVYLLFIFSQVPGIAETMRAHSIARDPMRMLARYVAGGRGATMIITLPGAPADLTDMMEVLRPVLSGAVEDIRTRRGA